VKNVRFVFAAYLATIVLGIAYVTVLGLVGR
jgi:hypothetical protein